LYIGLLAEYRGLQASIDLANTHIKKTEAYMDYTYGTDVSQKFSAHGVDDAELFSKPPRKSLCRAQAKPLKLPKNFGLTKQTPSS
jgi:hypothetical protein